MIRRSMVEKDLDQIIANDLLAHEYPWSRHHYLSSISSTHTTWVMEHDQQVIASIVASKVVDEVEILMLTVHPDHHRQGIAGQLLTELESVLNPRDLFLEVRASNQSAIAFYDTCGFVETGVRPNYYPSKSGREHAIIMAKTRI